MDDAWVTDPTHIPPSGTRAYGQPQSPERLDWVGLQAGSFKLTRLLGRGGMGMVYLGEHVLIGSRVAVKVLHPHLANDPRVVQRFFSEARAVNLIGHRNIVQIYDMSRLATGEWYLVMEYLEGQSAASLLERPQPPEDVAQILLEVLAALQAAHAHGIIHRDVKPENVFLTQRPQGRSGVKLLDFGIARFFGDTAAQTTQAGMILGTPAFMSPEQWQGGRVDARSDLYAVAALGRALLGDAPPFLSEVEQRKPTAIDSVLSRALSARAEDRYLSAAHMAEALERAVKGKAPAPLKEEPPRALPKGYAGVACVDGARTEVECSDLSRAGLFVRTGGPFPPLRTPVDLSVTLPGGTLEVRGEVVRHVPQEAARAWNMSPGYAVQFLEGGKTLSGRLRILLEPHPGFSRIAPPPPPVDVAAERRVRDLGSRTLSDPYAVLDVTCDASMPEVRRKARQLREELTVLSRAQLGTQAREQLVRVQECASQALYLLCDASRRAELDARRGNFLGVARCLAAGLSHEELSELRERSLRDRARHLARAQMHHITSGLHQNRGEWEDALRELERALTEDPLNLELHQEYWTLRRQRQQMIG